MFDTLLTHLQIFGIGFSFGIIGPCVLTCTPFIITYIAGRGRSFSATTADVSIFLTGRSSAYIILGGLAGLSGGILKQFIGSNLALFLRFLGGAISVLLGIFILIRWRKNMEACACGPVEKKTYDLYGLFVLGFTMGIKPCPPLLALLSEITLISKSALEGASYGLSFGLGTFVSSFIVVGALGGILLWLPPKIFKSKWSDHIFRIACASLLILFGLGLIMARGN